MTLQAGRAASAFDSAMRRCFAALLSVQALPSGVLRDAVAQAMLPVKEGGMALQQGFRRRHAAYVAACMFSTGATGAAAQRYRYGRILQYSYCM